MSQWRYDVVLRSPVGKRPGTASIEIVDHMIRGELYILNHSELLSGYVDEDGTCRINGILHTLSRQIPFIASGQITEEFLSLTLEGGKHAYHMTGLAVKKEEMH